MTRHLYILNIKPLCGYLEAAAKHRRVCLHMVPKCLTQTTTYALRKLEKGFKHTKKWSNTWLPRLMPLIPALIQRSISWQLLACHDLIHRKDFCSLSQGPWSREASPSHYLWVWATSASSASVLYNEAGFFFSCRHTHTQKKWFQMFSKDISRQKEKEKNKRKRTLNGLEYA